ncbi:DUF4041 domain-containing protein [Cytobacillus sp. FSL M8-0252]|uniref:DUF4041 domain-containing protein n=1 Tax=Cytobacillus sp. FSL M8-0252 TaxID=2921621 RepID=UPI0030FA4D0D
MFIAILFAFWFLIIPLIVGITLLLRQRKFDLENRQKMKTYKQDKEIELVKRTLNLEKREETLEQSENRFEQRVEEFNSQLVKKEKEVGIITLVQQLRILSMVKNKQQELENLESSIIDRKHRVKEVFKNKHHEIEKLNSQIKALKQEIISLEDEALYHSFGLYENKFDFESSEEYLEFLLLVREKQKYLIKNRNATNHLDSWTLNGSTRKGTANNNQNIKMAIRSFNHECDSIIDKVKFNNVEVAEKKIRTAFYQTNKLNRYNSIEISEEYLNLKIEELFLAYEYAQKKHEELEEQRRIRELLREERRVQKELEEELKKIKKEEQHLLNVLSNRSTQISEQEMFQYINRLNEIRKQIEEVDYRVKNTKAGYVYVISNIGCFGENVYKIGMTRRLDPLDRVRELGGASVPFHFDIHAVIFSEDAPALEASLHRAFHHRRVNRINQRKEFFKVELADIKKVVYQSHKKPVEFKMIAEAKEFRETKELEKKLAKQHII